MQLTAYPTNIPRATSVAAWVAMIERSDMGDERKRIAYSIAGHADPQLRVMSHKLIDCDVHELIAESTGLDPDVVQTLIKRLRLHGYLLETDNHGLGWCWETYLALTDPTGKRLPVLDIDGLYKRDVFVPPMLDRRFSARRDDASKGVFAIMWAYADEIRGDMVCMWDDSLFIDEAMAPVVMASMVALEDAGWITRVWVRSQAAPLGEAGWRLNTEPFLRPTVTHLDAGEVER